MTAASAMKSGELAALAGVSVRALRHYHQIGILPEPPRSANGYRRYDVRHLIRVLRIGRLAALGIALERMPGLLDEADETAAPLLEELDATLAAEIERLNERRRIVAQLREWETPPDLPLELARSLAAFARSSASPELSRIDRELSVLLAHLAGDEDILRLAELYEKLSDPAILPRITELSARFQQLDAGSGAAEAEALVDEIATTAELLVHGLGTEGPDLGAGALLLRDYRNTVLNATQRSVLERVDARLAAPRTA